MQDDCVTSRTSVARLRTNHRPPHATAKGLMTTVPVDVQCVSFAIDGMREDAARWPECCAIDATKALRALPISDC